MQPLTIDITNDKAVKLIEDMELLQLIRLHHEKPANADTLNSVCLKTSNLIIINNIVLITFLNVIAINFVIFG